MIWTAYSSNCFVGSPLRPDQMVERFARHVLHGYELGASPWLCRIYERYRGGLKLTPIWLPVRNLPGLSPHLRVFPPRASSCDQAVQPCIQSLPDNAHTALAKLLENSIMPRYLADHGNQVKRIPQTGKIGRPDLERLQAGSWMWQCRRPGNRFRASVPKLSCPPALRPPGSAGRCGRPFSGMHGIATLTTRGLLPTAFPFRQAKCRSRFTQPRRAAGLDGCSRFLPRSRTIGVRAA